MQVTVIASPRAPHQMAHQAAMAQGLGVIGIEPVMNMGGAPKTKHVAVWGWRQGKMLRQRGHEVCVMERGYLGDRFRWTSLGWNGLNGHATFPDAPDDCSRFDAHFAMKPWKQGGDYVLILGQVPGDASLQGRDLTPHYSDWAMKAQTAYESPVRFRMHPRAMEKGYRQKVRGAELSTGTLEEDLAGALVAICWNSNSAVDAVLAGVPTVTLDKGSMAWDVTAHRIGELARPHRRTWASRLAWRQWSLDEIASGEALRSLFELEMAHG